LDQRLDNDQQTDWYRKLKDQLAKADGLIRTGPAEQMRQLNQIFWNWVRTEEIKAWYGEPDDGSLFQGTSVTSLTVAAEFDTPIRIAGMEHLENAIADSYLAAHWETEPEIRGAILENVDHWMSEGAFYGIAIASKVVAQALGLSVPGNDVVFDVDGVTVDPHEITSYPAEIREKYFDACIQRLGCFEGLTLERRELESALVLADISKPKLDTYRDQILLAPVRCNELCTLISGNVRQLIIDKSGGEITPRSLMVTIFDTDTPYTYNQINDYFGADDAPVLPGLTVLGASGSIPAFRWLYAYRVSLVAQKMMKSSLWSEVERNFVPFVFFGVLVERDAEILLDLDALGLLRYRGQISPFIEYRYLLPVFQKQLASTGRRELALEIDKLIR